MPQYKRILEPDDSLHVHGEVRDARDRIYTRELETGGAAVGDEIRHPSDPDGPVVRLVGAPNEVTDPGRSDDALRRYADRLGNLQDLDRAILASTDPVEVARAALGPLRRLAPCWQTRVLSIDLDTGRATVLAAEGESAERFPAGADFPLEDLSSGEVEALCAGRDVVVEDVGDPGRARPRQVDGLVALGMRSYCHVPMPAGGQLIGCLSLLSDRLGPFAQESLEVAREVADMLAIAIRHARLFTEVRTRRDELRDLARRLLRAEEDERRRIAGELHDEIGQALTAMKLNIQAALRDQAAPAGSLLLEECIGLIDRTTGQVRDLSHSLRPSLLDDLGLLQALRFYVTGFARRSIGTAEFTAVGTIGRTDPDVATACFRVAQEALTNAMRHAAASYVMVELAQMDDVLRLTITDNGCGFDVAEAEARAWDGSSLGVLGMRERAAMAGGGLTIESAPGRGTTVRATFPLSPNETTDRE